MAESGAPATSATGVSDVGAPAADAPTGDAPTADARDRGATTIHDRVGERIGRQTALSIEGVLRHRGSLGMLTGHDYPRVSIDMSRAHPDVAVEVAVAWPSPIGTVCQEVRAVVYAELERLTGVTAHRVDVSVIDVTAPGPEHVSRVR